MELLPHKHKLIIFYAIVLTIFLFAIDFMVITPSLPSILNDIGGLKYINWVFTAFMLSQTIITPIYGKLSDIFCRKKMFLLAIVIFVTASMFAGLSQNIYELIIARAVQGIGGGALMVTAMSMIGEIFSLKERAKYQGYIGGAFAFASVAGPMVGAIITDELSWRWIFFINFPIGLLAFVILYKYLPNTLHQNKKASIDYVGSFLLVATLFPMLLMFSFVSDTKEISTMVIALFFISVVSFFLFYRTERKVVSPIFSHHLFHDRYFMIPALMTFVNAIVMFAVMLYVQIYAQKVLNFSLKESGLIMSAIAIPIAFTSPICGQIIARTLKYKKVVVVGALILFIAMLNFLYAISNGASGNGLIINLIPIGVGLGAMMSVFNIIVQMVYGRERMGEVMGALQLSRGVGGAFGTAFIGFVFSLFVEDINGSIIEISHAIIVIFCIISTLCFASLIISLLMKEKKML